MGVVELTGYPPVGQVVEAWVLVSWERVYWDGRKWWFEGYVPVPYPVTHWRAIIEVKA